MDAERKESRDYCERLVRASQTGSRDAFDELVRLFQKLAFEVAVRILCDANEAQEAVQKGFVKAYLNIASLKKPGSFKFWLLRIMANTAVTQARAKNRRKRKMNPAQYFKSKKQPSASAKQEQLELKEAIQKAMLNLSGKEARAISLFGLDGFSHKQVAETMKCSEQTSRWYVFKAREKLRNQLREYL